MNEEDKKRIAEYKKWAQEFEKAKTVDEITYVLKKNKFGWSDEKQATEKLKKFGKDKNIELAIARHCYDKEVREKLFFSSKNRQTKLACLEAEDIYNGPLWLNYIRINKNYLKFLKEANDEELYIYFTNKSFDLKLIENVLNREKPYDKIAEKKYRNIIIILENNSNTKNEPERENYRDPVENSTYEFDEWSLWQDEQTFEKFKKELAKIKKLRNLE